MLSSGPVRRDGLFCDFGSLFQKASRRQTASCCRRRRCGVVAAVCCFRGRVSNGPTRFSSVAAGLFWFLIGHLQQQHGGLHEEDEEQCNRWSGLQFQHHDGVVDVPGLFLNVQKAMEAQVQYICRIVDMTVCYNTKTAIRTVWSSGGTSDSVVIEWWTSRVMQRQAPVFSGWIALTKFPDLRDCEGVLGKRRTKNPRWELIKWPLAGETKEESSRPALEKICAHHPPRPRRCSRRRRQQRTQQVPSATRMSSCFRSDPERRDVDASATGFGPRPLDSGHQGKSEICNQRADKTSDLEDHEVRR